jgi:16S rRNA (cytidine1402-2'-O)-methyltransferase
MFSPSARGGRSFNATLKFRVVAGTLFVVATPIGNLEDITLRALRVLREVDLVAAEDTRRTGNLLRHFEIHTPLLSLHEHNELARVPKVLEHLRAGRSLALVSDAGTPGISDPGATIVRAVREAGFPVVPIPGPSAVATAISAAGLKEGKFAFGEFPPIRSKDRKLWFEWVAQHRHENIVFFEAPHRVLQTLAELASILGEQPILGGREVTKLHEEWMSGSAKVLTERFAEPTGEFVFVIPASEGNHSERVPPDDAEICRRFGQITENAALSRRDAVKQVAESLGLAPKYVYDAIERAKRFG